VSLCVFRAASPVKHSKANHQRTKDIQVDSDVDWQKQHYKSLETAYRGSPFFEFFEDDIRPFFEKHKFLLDLNFETLEIISKCLRVKFDYITTSEYATAVDPSIISDCRYCRWEKILALLKDILKYLTINMDLSTT
jgi:hypothetical protein